MDKTSGRKMGQSVVHRVAEYSVNAPLTILVLHKSVKYGARVSIGPFGDTVYSSVDFLHDGARDQDCQMLHGIV